MFNKRDYIRLAYLYKQDSNILMLIILLMIPFSVVGLITILRYILT